jgi:hypothetical protein
VKKPCRGVHCAEAQIPSQVLMETPHHDRTAADPRCPAWFVAPTVLNRGSKLSRSSAAKADGVREKNLVTECVPQRSPAKAGKRDDSAHAVQFSRIARPHRSELPDSKRKRPSRFVSPEAASQAPYGVVWCGAPRTGGRIQRLQATKRGYPGAVGPREYTDMPRSVKRPVGLSAGNAPT